MQIMEEIEARPFSNLAKYYLGLIGVLAFPLMHFSCQMILKVNWPWISSVDRFRISTRLVSALQSIMVVCVSARTVIVCKNILKDQDPWLHAYIWFGLSYFLYDVVVMYIGYSLTQKLVKNENSLVTFFKSFSKFFKKECIMVLHHLIFLFVGFPIVEFYKQGLGDFFVGCFFLAEISTPFYSLKGILREIDIKSGMIYEANGIVFMITFLIGRVLSVPFMYLRYARFAGLSVTQVPLKIPLKCNVVSLLFLCLQCYWFSLICFGIFRHLKSTKLKRELNDNNVSNGTFDNGFNQKIQKQK